MGIKGGLFWCEWSDKMIPNRERFSPQPTINQPYRIRI